MSTTGRQASPRAPWALVVACLASSALAGCVADSSAQAPSTDSAPTAVPTTSAPPPLGTVEVHNASYVFPHDENGPHANESFRVPAGVARLVARVQVTQECPVGHAEGARIVVTSPQGWETELDGVPSNGYYAICGRSRPPVDETGLDAEPGAWRVRTEGGFTGCVRVVVTANPTQRAPADLGACDGSTLAAGFEADPMLPGLGGGRFV